MAFGRRFTQKDIDVLRDQKKIQPAEVISKPKDKTKLQIKEKKISPIDFETQPFDELICPRHVFSIRPFPAPRMTKSDKWKTDPYHPDPKKRQRKCVMKYFAFKNELNRLAAKQGYKLESVVNILFVVAMPKSWPAKKKNKMDRVPHQQRPDRDNYLKAFQDAFDIDDGFVWDGRAIKIWGTDDKIVIF